MNSHRVGIHLGCARFALGIKEGFRRMLASVYANHDPQPTNANQVMVIMFSVELGAVDEPHRHLKPFMKGRGLLQFGRGLSERIDEVKPARLEFPKSLRQ